MAKTVYVRVGVWMYGCVGVWVYSCVGVWVYVCMICVYVFGVGVCVHGCMCMGA